MPRVERLKARPDFLRVAAARTKWVTPGLILQARRRIPVHRPDAAPALPSDRRQRPDAPDVPPERGKRGATDQNAVIRVGFTVSRKVGNAVRRNRARRRLRAVAMAVLPERGCPGTDYVLIGRSGTLDRPYPALIEDLRQALEGVKGHRPRRDRRGNRRPRDTRPRRMPES